MRLLLYWFDCCRFGNAAVTSDAGDKRKIFEAQAADRSSMVTRFPRMKHHEICALFIDPIELVDIGLPVAYGAIECTGAIRRASCLARSGRAGSKLFETILVCRISMPRPMPMRVFGMLYAQAEDDFPRIEQNYIWAIGRLAEIEGEAALASDIRARLFMTLDEAKAGLCWGARMAAGAVPGLRGWVELLSRNPSRSGTEITDPALNPGCPCFSVRARSVGISSAFL